MDACVWVAFMPKTLGSLLRAFMPTPLFRAGLLLAQKQKGLTGFCQVGAEQVAVPTGLTARASVFCNEFQDMHCIIRGLTHCTTSTCLVHTGDCTQLINPPCTVDLL